MNKIEAFVQGRVIALNVKTGQTVSVGDVLLMVDSMKMEIPLEAERAGIVEEICVVVGEEIAEGQVVMVIA